MNELLSVNEECQTVSARELHAILNIQKRFSAWFETNKESFIEDIDFTSVPKSTLVNNGATRTLDDYQLSLDMAKHICLMSRTEKGKQCRQYLIDLEKAWNTPEQVMARALKLADKTIDDLRLKISDQQLKIEEMKPKEIFADAVSASQTSILVGELAKLLKQNGVDIGQNRLFEWLRNNGYLIKKKGSDWNLPTQKAMNMKLFEVCERTINNPDGSVKITRTTKATGKAQIYFINKFLKQKEEEESADLLS